jgi:alkanesulfonate monooxygenase SsuD/methylene tetrahydromethanopterin reductase-like flavin-dependent oxidoreductase (luciferase family)
LGGERVTVDARYVRLDDVALDWPPHGPRSAVLAGATGPWSLRLTGEAVAEAVGRLVEAGADSVVLQPTADEPDPERFVRFTAAEVRPLVP